MEVNNCRSIAVRLAAQAVLLEMFKVARVATISVVSGRCTVEYVYGDPERSPVMQEKGITAFLAGVCAGALFDGAESIFPETVEEAFQIASMQRMVGSLANYEMLVSRSWGQTQLSLAGDIMKHLKAWAAELVTANKDRILRVAEVLAASGMLSGEEFAAI